MTTPLEMETAFSPRFDAQGLIPCITTSAKDGTVLMFAWMNKEALDKTIKTGEAHYWSRSRKQLWHKGDTSGNVQKVLEIRTDCDQDCIWLSVKVKGEEIACHTGNRSCFYRVVKGSKLEFIE
jgi:phosphoribosyl-AMP cyclohydrolase